MIKVLKPLSEWLKFKLASTDLLDPPVFAVRIAPASVFAVTMAADRDQGIPEAYASLLIEAIKEWDLMLPDEHGAPQPVPCTAEMKEKLRPTLKMLFGTKLAGEDGKAIDKILGVELFNYLANAENFLGN